MENRARQVYQFGPFRVDVTDSQLFRGTKVVPLSPKVFDTLLLLIQNRGRTVGKDELMRQLWPDSFVEESNLSQNIFQVRKALGEANSGPQYIETIPKRGYRFAASVQEICDGKDEEILVHRHSETTFIIEEQEDGENIFSADQEKSNRQINFGPNFNCGLNRRLVLIGSFALLITITGGLYIWQQARAGRHGNSELGAKTIAVLPFRPLDSESNDEQLRLGLADALISRLSNLRDITVRPTSAVLRYSDTPRNTTTPGLELGADAVLDGTIQKVGNHLRVNVQLVRVSDGVAVWSQKFDEQFNDVLTLEDSISEQVATKLIGKLSNETRTYLANRPRNTEAYEAYVRGRYFWNKRSEEKYRKALNQFQEAIDFDPSYALAYSGLADCYLFLAFESAQVSEDNYERARAAAVRALELDQRLAEAHTTLAAIAAVHDRNWSEAEKEYKKAIESNPNYSTAHHWYAWDLLMANRLEEALFEMRKAHELDPLSTNVNTALGQIYYYMRRYDEAVEQFKKTIDLDADNIISRNFLAMAYEQKGMFAEAIAEYQKILERNRTDVFALGGNAHAHALMRRKTEAQRFLAALKKRVDSPAVVNYQIAAVYTALGDRTEAVRWLERIPHGSLKDVLVPLKFDPRLDQLRDYPKYKSYLRNLS